MSGGKGSVSSLPIRYRLTIIYSILVAVTFLLFSVILYQYLESRLKEDIDVTLRNRTQLAGSLIVSYWQLNEESATGELPPMRMPSDNRERFDAVARMWVRYETDPAELMGTAIHVFDPSGESIAASKDIDQSVSLSAKAFGESLGGKPYFETVDTEYPIGAKARLRVVTLPQYYNGELIYILQGAMRLSQLDNAMSQLLVILLFLVPALILLSAIIGFYMTRMTLRPMQEIINDIKGIDDVRLSKRVSIPSAPGEIFDLSESFNRMLDRLDSAFESQQQLVSDISHQLKTPLAVLKGELETTLRRVRSAQEYEVVLESNLEEVEKMIRIIESMLVLARFEANEFMLAKVDTDLGLMIRGVADDLFVLAEQKGVHFTVEAETGTIVSFDPHKLRQALINIVENAIKYTVPGGDVSMSLATWGESAEIRIRDRGPGVREEDREAIFSRFYRAKDANVQGFGLGLSITAAIIDLHGGSVEVQPRGGGGSIFIIRLPLGSDPVLG